MAWYNGFSTAERDRMASRKGLERSGHPLPKEAAGPCMLCADPDTPVEPHAEDYAKPYTWVPPKTYWLCQYCHRTMLHNRFRKPARWAAYLAHVRRGGYGREFRDDPAVKREISAYLEAMEKHKEFQLRTLRTGRSLKKEEWWDAITLDPACAEPGYPKPPYTREQIFGWNKH